MEECADSKEGYIELYGGRGGEGGGGERGTKGDGGKTRGGVAEESNAVEEVELPEEDSGGLLASFAGHEYLITCVCWSPDGHTVVSGERLLHSVFFKFKNVYV